MKEQTTTTRIQPLRLSELYTGDEAVIVRVAGQGAFRKRITEMGFVRGQKVTVIKNAPLKDPVEYEIMGYKISLRRSEASLIEVARPGRENFSEPLSYYGTSTVSVSESNNYHRSQINIALVGNPNCGKTTLFNLISGAHERVGNYGGVTIEAKEAEIDFNNYSLRLTDLPGTYSLTEYTPEELFVRSHLLEQSPDIVINVLDASNIERNLYLTTQLIDMNVKVVIALNMYDELEASGAKLNHAHLSALLGMPIVPTVAAKGIGIKTLLETAINTFNGTEKNQRLININYGNEIESRINSIVASLSSIPSLTDKYSLRYLAVKMLEQDKSTINEVMSFTGDTSISALATENVKALEVAFRESASTVIADAKYGFIAGALGECYSPAPSDKKSRKKDIDNILTHKYFGFPIFLFFMWLMFQATFTLGSYPMDWIDTGVSALSGFITDSMQESMLRDLLVDGIIGGVGGVIIFLPNILLLFFFISLMEDTGYMARAAFIMDKLMHKIGLHGKSFIPLLMGFGCNVPAVMATRTLENKKDRILTMLITPFMSCSARLPVYVLIISATFQAYHGMVLLSIYLIGILVAVLVAMVLKRVAFAHQDVPFVMELPPYRIPTLRNTLKHMWFKGVQYINKMGTVILLASILIWALGYFPRTTKFSTDYDAQIEQIRNSETLSKEDIEKQIFSIEVMKESERQANSFIGRMGKFIEPAIVPLGFDWKIGVSILTGLAAKEIIVSTMGVLYQSGIEETENSVSLQQKLKEQVHTHGELAGQRVFTPLAAFSFMIFILIYFPCVAVIAAIRKESNWRWAVFTMVYTTGIAYLLSLIIYQTGKLLG